MPEPPYPLDRPLPPDVAAAESTFIRFYQQYTVFSWPWAWRRTVLFGTLGALAGASFGASHGLFVKDFSEGVVVTLACTAANLVLIGAGPMLAAFFRYRGWPRAIERTSIVAAIIFGIVASAVADDRAESFHDRLMAEHEHPATDGTALKAVAADPAPDTHALVQRTLEKSGDLLLLFLASGGFALPAYFTEKRRWAEHFRRVALEKLGLEKSEADLKLTVLQAQVEPHFLFNTLASVRSLVASDPQRAAQTIDALAQHLRATLPMMRAQTGASHSTLAGQFAICVSYLELMKLRLGERLRVELDLPFDLRDAPYPPLLLISLVENAIKHGVEPKPGVTTVALSARVIDARRIEVRVENDGKGLALGMGEGTGLANIRAQLLARFGSDASFELSERDSGGVVARLIVPLEPHRS